MTFWPVQDAKARFNELLETCLREGPQIVTKRGAEAVGMVPVAEWRRLQQTARQASRRGGRLASAGSGFRPVHLGGYDRRVASGRRVDACTRSGEGGRHRGWVDQIAGTFNVLPMDAAAFRNWARLMHRRSKTLAEDAMIAATAIAHKLVVVTRDVRDFKKLDVATLDPFEDRR